MAETRDSLIQGAKRQMELIPSSAMDASLFCEDEAQGEFTGERLFAREPEKYRLVISLLAEGIGINRIAKIVGVSPGTVTAVRNREPVPIGIEKEGLAQLAHTGARMLLEGVVARAGSVATINATPIRDLAVAAAVLIDKGQLLSGEATMRIEHEEFQAPEHEDFNRYLAKLKSAKAPQTGLGGERPTQKEAAASAAMAGPAGVAEVVEVASGPGGDGIIDAESGGKQ